MRQFVAAVLLVASCNSGNGSTVGDMDRSVLLDVGRPCINPTSGAPLGTQISSPALECESRLCLIQPTPRATCTANCVEDADCGAANLSQCAAGFVCAVALDTGPFRCQRLCVCKDDTHPVSGCP
jgi:hypothetical protein